MGTKQKKSLIKTPFFKGMLVIVLLTLTVIPLFAQGNLLIYPKRLVFEGRTKIKKLVLSNIGKDTAVYKISFLEYKMEKSGAFKIITTPEPGQRFASSKIRFYPRRVTLAPRESQTVKVQLSSRQQLTEGEYRSHLYFRAVKEKVALGEIEKTQDSTMSVSLTPVFGLAIPCIVRKGTDNTTVSIAKLEFIKSKNAYRALKFHMIRSGNMSVYGDFTINYIATDNTVYEVAKIKGVGIYTPGTLREMKIRLKNIENRSFEGGFFKLVFTKNESEEILTEAILKL
ncbi:MAG: molecular chaperone [Flavobacteriaceae bacterium]|nr:molecular chaperone [Flavobacteriaceae bacterium]